MSNDKNASNIIHDIVYIVISTIIILYMIFIVSPFATEWNFFSEGILPEKSLIFKYKIMVLPVLITYLIYSGLKINTFNKYMKLLAYPITLITDLILVFFWELRNGGLLMDVPKSALPNSTCLNCLLDSTAINSIIFH